MASGEIIKIDGKAVSKVGVALIEKVAAGIGGLYRPTQLVRLAKAQAKADVISAQAAVEVSELSQRAMQRFVVEEAKRQANIEDITADAIPLLDENADPANVNDDWIANFFEKSRIVSDAEMQSLWSNLLAGESNSPGKFSKRTVNLLSDLDKHDAVLFASLCGYLWEMVGARALIFDATAEIYNANGINFASLTHLDSLGLITFGNITDYSLNGLPATVGTVYHGKLMLLNAVPPIGLNVGKVMLTKAGEQLAGVVKADEVKGFYEYVAQRFAKNGLNVVNPAQFLTVNVQKKVSGTIFG